VLRERYLDTCAVYAPDMWPIIGLKRTAIVVGGSETGDEEREQGADGDEKSMADSDDWVAVVSGGVVNRMPVDTIER
jgi:hypothetical protein